MSTYKYTLEGLHCANCADKIETAIGKHPSTKNTALNFANKTLSFFSTNDNAGAVKQWTQNIVNSIEDGVEVVSLTDKADHKKKNNHDVLKIFISLGIFAAAAIFEYLLALPVWLYAPIYGAAILLCGYKVFISGFKALIKLRLDENTLMSIAVIAAFCIQEFPEAALVTLLFSIGEVLEERAVDKSRRDIAKLAEIRPDTARLLTEQGTQTVAAETVSIGDTIVISPFERVPLDGEILSGQSDLDASALTGESMPVFAEAGTKIMSGMMNKEGLLTVKVTSSYENSSASRILKMVEDAAATKGSSEKFITKFARVYTPIVMLAAIILVLFPPLFGGDFTEWLYRALVFLVASCPCAVVISVPLGFYSGIGGASKSGVIIKGGKYIEALANADAFVFDKTGTLTTGLLTVQSVETAGTLSKDELIALAAAVELHSVHPVAAAIKNYASKLTLPTLSNYQETAGVGVSAEYQGKTVVCGNDKILKNQNGKKGVIYLTVDGALQGAITVADTLRRETPSVIGALRAFGAKTVTMLTGDSNAAAQKIAVKANLTDYHAELLPENKVELVNQIKAESRGVVFVGDGINDAPVIAASDCGIAMGLGSQAAIESADVVLTSGNLKALPTAVKHARRVMNVVRGNIVFALTVKLVILVLAVFGITPMWLAVFADTGVSLLCVLNASRLLKIKN